MISEKIVQSGFLSSFFLLFQLKNKIKNTPHLLVHRIFNKETHESNYYFWGVGVFLMPRELFSSVQRSVLCLQCLFNNVSVEALQLNVLCLYCHWAICLQLSPSSLSLFAFAALSLIVG